MCVILLTSIASRNLAFFGSSHMNFVLVDGLVYLYLDLDYLHLYTDKLLLWNINRIPQCISENNRSNASIGMQHNCHLK